MDTEQVVSEPTFVDLSLDPGQSQLDFGKDSVVPLSFPAILRNSKIKDRYAYLHERPHRAKQDISVRKSSKYDNEGRRWLRRKGNGKSHVFSTFLEIGLIL